MFAVSAVLALAALEGHGRLQALAAVDGVRRELEEQERGRLELLLARCAAHPGTGHPLSGVRLTNRGSAPYSRFWRFAGDPVFYHLFLFDERDVVDMARELRPWIEARRDSYGDLALAQAGAGGRPTKLDFVDRTLLLLYVGTKDAQLCEAAALFRVSLATVSRDVWHLLAAFHDGLATECVWPDAMAQHVRCAGCSRDPKGKERGAQRARRCCATSTSTRSRRTSSSSWTAP